MMKKLVALAPLFIAAKAAGNETVHIVSGHQISDGFFQEINHLMSYNEEVDNAQLSEGDLTSAFWWPATAQEHKDGDKCFVPLVIAITKVEQLVENIKNAQ